MTRRSLLITGGVLLVLAVAVGLLVVFFGGGRNAIDDFWGEVMVGIRQPWMLFFAQVLNDVGGGWVAIFLIPILLIAVLVLLRRWRAAVYAATAFVVSAALTQLLKHLFGRARPEDMLVASDFGSFPSGHSANAATIAVVLWLVFPRVWVAILGGLWVVLMALSRTVLLVHWLTDTLGGALVGASAAFLVAGVFWSWSSLGWTDPPTVSPRSSRAEDPPVP